MASGVRRIEATTGKLTLEVMNRNQELLFQAAAVLKAKPGELREKAEAAHGGDARAAPADRRSSRPGRPLWARPEQLPASAAKTVGGLKVLTATVPKAGCANACGRWATSCGTRSPTWWRCWPPSTRSKITFLAVCGKEAVARGIKAGDIIKKCRAICGGKGGGKPDSAMGGGKDPLKLDDALGLGGRLCGREAGPVRGRNHAA